MLRLATLLKVTTYVLLVIIALKEADLLRSALLVPTLRRQGCSRYKTALLARLASIVLRMEQSMQSFAPQATSVLRALQTRQV